MSQTWSAGGWKMTLRATTLMQRALREVDADVGVTGWYVRTVGPKWYDLQHRQVTLQKHLDSGYPHPMGGTVQGEAELTAATAEAIDLARRLSRVLPDDWSLNKLEAALHRPVGYYPGVTNNSQGWMRPQFRVSTELVYSVPEDVSGAMIRRIKLSGTALGKATSLEQEAEAAGDSDGAGLGEAV